MCHLASRQPIAEVLQRLQPRSPMGSSGIEVLTERTLHVESCFDWLVRALQRHLPSVQCKACTKTNCLCHQRCSSRLIARGPRMQPNPPRAWYSEKLWVARPPGFQSARLSPSPPRSLLSPSSLVLLGFRQFRAQRCSLAIRLRHLALHPSPSPSPPWRHSASLLYRVWRRRRPATSCLP